MYHFEIKYKFLKQNSTCCVYTNQTQWRHFPAESIRWDRLFSVSAPPVQQDHGLAEGQSQTSLGPRGSDASLTPAISLGVGAVVLLGLVPASHCCQPSATISAFRSPKLCFQREQPLLPGRLWTSGPPLFYRRAGGLSQFFNFCNNVTKSPLGW